MNNNELAPETIEAAIANDQAAIVTLKKMSLEALMAGNRVRSNELEQMADAAMRIVQFRLLLLHAITN